MIILSGLIFINSSLYSGQKPYDLTVIESNRSYMDVDVQFKEAVTTQEKSGGSWYSKITIPGCSYTRLENYPRLPFTQILLGIPPEGDPEIELLEKNTVTQTVGAIATVPVSEEKTAGHLDFQLDTIYPENLLQLYPSGFVRTQRIVKIGCHPVRYNFATQTVEIVKSLRFRLYYSADAVESVSVKSTTDSNTGFESFYKAHLANYEAARTWRREPVKSLNMLKSSSYLDVANRYKIYVEEDGIYAISGKELEDKGVDLASINPRTLSMLHKGTPIPIVIEGEEDGRFDRDDRIIFIGYHNYGDNTYYSWYSSSNVYWLVWGSGIGARFSQINGADSGVIDTLSIATTTKHLERDLIYERLLEVPREDIDHWFWTQFHQYEGSAENKTDGEYTFDLKMNHVVDQSMITVDIELFGNSSLAFRNPDHHVIVKLNQQELDHLKWDGRNKYTYHKHVPFTAAENNKISFFLSGFDDSENPNQNVKNIDAVFLNYMTFSYQTHLIAERDSLRFTISRQQPVMVKAKNFHSEKPYIFTSEGQQIVNYQSLRHRDNYTIFFVDRFTQPTNYFIAGESQLRSVIDIVEDKESDLKNMSNQADYLIITHEKFIEQAQRLADYRLTPLMKTRVVDVQEIYDLFNDGIYDPRAIKEFVSFTFQNWQKPAPAFVLLFGDTSHLMDKELAKRDPKYKSYVPTMMEFTRTWGMTSSDNYFVAVHGNDDLPDMYIGRLPAATIEEAENLVNKTIDYELHSVIDDWRRQVCLLSGSDEGLMQMSMKLYENYIPPRIVTNFLNTDPESPYYGTTETLANYFNNGQLLLTFLGHGGGAVYLDDDLFLTRDIALLNNKNKYPVIFSITCFVGHFDNPETPSLGELLIKSRDKGIVAHFGSVARSYIGYFDNMHESLYDAIFNIGAGSLGEITTLGKFNASRQGAGYWDHMKNYVLMGDPALQLGVPNDDIEMKLSRQTLRSGDTLSVQGNLDHQSGTLVLSVHTEKGEKLLSKKVQIENGPYEEVLFTLDSNMRRYWPNKTGKGIIRGYYQNAQGDDGASAVIFNINRPILAEIIPLQPKHLDPVYFEFSVDSLFTETIGKPANIMLQWTFDKAEWKTTSMSERESDIWKTSVPLIKPGGTTIYYRLKIELQSKEIFYGEEQRYYINKLADLYLDQQSIRVGGRQQLHLSALIKNYGQVETGAFRVQLYTGSSSDNAVLLDTQTIQNGLQGMADSTIYFQLPGSMVGLYRFMFQVDAANEVTESNELNNTTAITKKIVTISQGSGTYLYSGDCSYSVQIPAGASEKNTSVYINRLSDPKYTDTSEKSNLLPLELKWSKSWYACEYMLEDSSDLKKPLQIQAYYNDSDSINQMYIDQEALRLYGWNTATNTWLALEDSKIDEQNKMVTASLPPNLKIFGLFATLDTQAPSVSIGIKGQNFANGDIISSKPVFSILLEDDSGFDKENTAIRILLDDLELSPEKYSIFQNTQERKKLSITCIPDELESGEHRLVVEAYDINRNLGSADIDFVVNGEFQLLSIANHPNPFSDETTIAFHLTEMADEVKLNIYTVSGHLIRSIRLYEVMGYVEYDWDATDEEGREIANGVYYLKFIAKKAEKNIESIEKLAKLQ